MTLADWRRALAARATTIDRPLLVASWRGGALIDDAVGGAIGWWRMAPLAGAALLRTMLRARIAGERERGRSVTGEALRATLEDGPLELAGNRLSAEMVAQLDAASPAVVAPLRMAPPGHGLVAAR